MHPIREFSIQIHKSQIILCAAGLPGIILRFGRRRLISDSGLCKCAFALARVLDKFNKRQMPTRRMSGDTARGITRETTIKRLKSKSNLLGKYQSIVVYASNKNRADKYNLLISVSGNKEICIVTILFQGRIRTRCQLALYNVFNYKRFVYFRFYQVRDNSFPVPPLHSYIHFNCSAMI